MARPAAYSCSPGFSVPSFRDPSASAPDGWAGDAPVSAAICRPMLSGDRRIRRASGAATNRNTHPARNADVRQPQKCTATASRTVTTVPPTGMAALRQVSARAR